MEASTMTSPLPRLVAVSAALASGCAVEVSTPSGDVDEVPLAGPSAVDILFVVDDSPGMRDEQEGLATSFGRLVDGLRDADGQLPDLHIGVVSSDVGGGPDPDGLLPSCAGLGDDGQLQVAEGCPPLTDGARFIRDGAGASGEREVNYTGELADQFACMARLGTSGCGFEQHLESMRRALAGANDGFLRPEAALAVVILADEDDCSARDPALFSTAAEQNGTDTELGPLGSFRCFEFGVECDPVDGGERSAGDRSGCAPEAGSPYVEEVDTYVEFLRGLKADLDQIFIATITGDAAPVAVGMIPGVDPPLLRVEPACTVCPGGASTGCNEGGTDPNAVLVAAAPGIRLRAFAGAFGDAGQTDDICSYDPAIDALDFSGPFASLALRLRPAP
jgi:hypothetical protein